MFCLRFVRDGSGVHPIVKISSSDRTVLQGGVTAGVPSPSPDRRSPRSDR